MMVFLTPGGEVQDFKLQEGFQILSTGDHLFAPNMHGLMKLLPRPCVTIHRA